jgi:glycosyltransferase involved in cell wall biosynthesis
MTVPVSVVVMTKNEERNIAACLASVDDFGEVFVVDSHSDDATVKIAAQFGARIETFFWDGGYPKKKQWCLETLDFSYPWVLYLDADERMTPELVREIAERANLGFDCAGYFISLDYRFCGRVLRHGHRVRKLALFERRRGRFLDYDDLDAANMWEVEGHYQPSVDGGIRALRGRLLHDDHDSLYHWFERHNRYSDWEAVLLRKQALTRSGESQPRLRRAAKRVFERAPARGLISFVHGYIFQLGFLDGRAGLEYAIARSFYYWQVGLKAREFSRRSAAT